MTRRPRLPAALAPALLLAACGGAQPGAPLAASGGGQVRIEDGAGEHETSRAQPRIVSLNPCSDAILAEVTAPGQLLAVSHYSHDPASSSMDMALAMRFPAVSDAVEEVLAHRPDVVVAGAFLPPATRGAFERLGIRVVTLGIAPDVATSEAQVRDLARLAGEPARGEALVGRIETALAAAAPPPGSARLSAIVWEPGGIVAGDDTLVADLLARTGFANAAAARGLSQASYLPLEAMLADPPRVLMVASDAPGRMLAHPALRGLVATTRARVPENLVWCGGPTIVRAAARLKAIRREATRQDGKGPEAGAAAPGTRL